MNEILFLIGDWPVRVADGLIGISAFALVLLLALVIVVAKSGRRGAELAVAQAIRADELEERLTEMLRAQSESTGRVDAMAQALAGRQADMRTDTIPPPAMPSTSTLPSSFCIACILDCSSCACFIM